MGEGLLAIKMPLFDHNYDSNAQLSAETLSTQEFLSTCWYSYFCVEEVMDFHEAT